MMLGLVLIFLTYLRIHLFFYRLTPYPKTYILSRIRMLRGNFQQFPSRMYYFLANC